MAVKFYAVKSGKTPGIYNTWEDCKAQTDGFSGAVYKSFSSVEEACAFLGWTSPANNPAPQESVFNPIDYTLAHPKSAIAYVDGSYNDATKEFSYGVVMFAEGKQIHFAAKSDDPDLVSMRNVAGEIKGSEAAMRYAYEHSYSSITIYHDYEGISKWCLGLWKTNKDGTIAYKAFYEEMKKHLNIEFIKVKGHSNDKYNDLADSLAKEAVGI